MNEDLFGHIVEGLLIEVRWLKTYAQTVQLQNVYSHHFGQKLAQSVNAIRSGSNFSACAGVTAIVLVFGHSQGRSRRCTSRWS